MTLKILVLIFEIFVSTEGLRFQMLKLLGKELKFPMEINVSIFSLKSKQICNFHSEEPDQSCVYEKRNIIKRCKLNGNLLVQNAFIIIL